jgi:hypothetical protein
MKLGQVGHAVKGDFGADISGRSARAQAHMHGARTKAFIQLINRRGQNLVAGARPTMPGIMRQE